MLNINLPVGRIQGKRIYEDTNNIKIYINVTDPEVILLYRETYPKLSFADSGKQGNECNIYRPENGLQTSVMLTVFHSYSIEGFYIYVPNLT